MKAAHIQPDASFDKAFAAARNAGCDRFIWRDAEYHTKTKEEDTPHRSIILRITEREG